MADDSGRANSATGPQTFGGWGYSYRGFGGFTRSP